MTRLQKLGFYLFQVQIGDDNTQIAIPELAPGYTIEKVMPHDLLPWAKPEYDLSEAFLREAIERGDRCVANFFEGELVGYGFVTQRNAPVTDQLQVVVGNNLVYRYKGWTHPDHRRKRLSYARGRLNRLVFPLRDGRRTVSYVATHNFASKLNPSVIHPVFLGYCGYIRWFGQEYPFTLRTPRRFGFRLVRRHKHDNNGRRNDAPG